MNMNISIILYTFNRSSNDIIALSKSKKFNFVMIKLGCNIGIVFFCELNNVSKSINN